MEKLYDIAVIGDGLIGTTLARLLAINNWQVIHFCRKSPPWDTGLALSLNQSSRRILMDAGIWQHIPANMIGRFDCVQVWDSDGYQLDFTDDKGLPGYVVQQRDLLRALRVGDPTDNPVTKITTPIKRLTTHNAEIETTTGDHWQARLIIAADGADSKTREQAKIQRQVISYRQNALVGQVCCEKKHGHIARQFFLPTGPLALLPQADENDCFVVWSANLNEASRLQEVSTDTFARELEKASDHILGKLSLTGELKIWPLRRLEACDYFCDRLVLAGDTAHVPHPLAGIGANLGLMDAQCLVTTLAQAKDRGWDIGTRRVLRAYERRRRPVNHLALTVMDTLKYIFAAQGAFLPSVRRFGMRGLAATPSCQRWLARAAAGLYDDWPWQQTTVTEEPPSYHKNNPASRHPEASC